MSYLDEFISKTILAKLKLSNGKKRNVIGVIAVLVSLFFILAGIYVWYTGNYLPSTYGLKAIGTVYKRESGRKSANDIYLYYKVNGITYHVMGGVNSYENYIGKQVEMGENFCVLYYSKHPEWSAIDFFAPLPIDTTLQLKQEPDLSYVDFVLQVEDERSHKLLDGFEVSIHTNSINETYAPDSIGIINLTLPNKEDLYTIKISCNNYVSKFLEINTKGINNKSGKKDFTISAFVEMIKKQKGVDYTVFDAPLGKAYLINDSTIDWDEAYSNKMQMEIKEKR